MDGNEGDLEELEVADDVAEEREWLREWSSRYEGPGLTRRVFGNQQMHLYVWEGQDGAPKSIQLCYDVQANEHVFLYDGESRRHHRVSEPATPQRNSVPIFVQDGHFDPDLLARRFSRCSIRLPKRVQAFVLKGLNGKKSPD